VTTYRFDRCEVRPAERQLLVDGQPVPIGARAFDLLLALIERRDRVVSKNELLDVVWPGLVVEENNLQVQVGALRKVLGQDAIATVPGRGYRITLQPSEDKVSASPPPAAANSSVPSNLESPPLAGSADGSGSTGDGAARPAPAPGASGSKLRWPAFSAAAILLILLATLSWNYWKPASQRDHTTVASAVGGAAPVHSIAILPFAAPGGGAADAQLADSLTRDLTAAFGRIRWARVVSYALASTYKGKAIDARLVGRELNVRYLVEGEVRSGGEVFIADIRLVDTGTATQVWSNRLKLERGSTEQDPGALVTPLIQQLRIALHGAEHRRIGTESAIDATAVELWLRGDNVLSRETDLLKGALEARKLYDEALRLDPRLVGALIERGWTLDIELALNRHALRDRLVQELDDLSMRAVALDPDDSNVWALRSKALAWQWRWDAALEANSKQQSLDRTRAEAFGDRALLMSLIGKPAEALLLVDQALALNPLDLGFPLRMRCRSYLVLGRYKDAIDACEKSGAFEDDWTVHFYLVAAYAHEGEVAKAEAAKAALLRRRPGFSIADHKRAGYSNEPAWLQQNETHLYSGLRKAGIAEQ
jgi:DNA-binding winged helix-turn-helix (wHTH) protein/TolB-like protein/tetratricopeptide (TPR) repeat protein